jgi:hypothetical protein
VFERRSARPEVAVFDCPVAARPFLVRLPEVGVLLFLLAIVSSTDGAAVSAIIAAK